MLTTLKPKTFPLLNPASKCSHLVSHGANVFNMCPFPVSPALYVQNLFIIGPAVWPQPLTPPPRPNAAVGHRGANCFQLMSIHRRVPNLVPKLVPFGSIPRLKCLTPYPPPRIAPWGIEGRIVFSLCPFQNEYGDLYNI